MAGEGAGLGEKNHAREGDWKKNSVRRKSEGKKSCRVNLTSCTCLNGTLAASLYCSFN